MADPIKVDFRKKRPANKPAVRAAQPPPAARRPRPPRTAGEPMLNWRAMPRLLAVVAIIVMLMVAWRWFTHG